MSNMKSNSINLTETIKKLSNLPYKIGKYKSRNWGHPFHSLISYPSKLKPSIAHFLVKLFSHEGQVILDPFSGVGTIPFEACSQGRKGIGSDLSPLGFYATNAKVNPPSKQEIIEQLNNLSNYIIKNQEDISEKPEKEIIEYYHSDTLKEILAAKEFFKSYRQNDENMSFLLTCTLHILHGNRPYALSRRSHNVMPWPPKGPFVYKSLIKSLTEKVDRMYKTPLPLGFIRGESYQMDAFNLEYNDSSIDCIITSPPFYKSRDFLRMNRIRLWFCGWDYNHQEKMKESFLEHEKELSSYQKIFSEFHRVLKPQSLCILHLGVVKKTDMGKQISPYAVKENLEVVDIIYEDVTKIESHGIVDSGATHKHQFLIIQKR